MVLHVKCLRPEAQTHSATLLWQMLCLAAEYALKYIAGATAAAAEQSFTVGRIHSYFSCSHYLRTILRVSIFSSLYSHAHAHTHAHTHACAPSDTRLTHTHTHTHTHACAPSDTMLTHTHKHTHAHVLLPTRSLHVYFHPSSARSLLCLCLLFLLLLRLKLFCLGCMCDALMGRSRGQCGLRGAPNKRNTAQVEVQYTWI